MTTDSVDGRKVQYKIEVEPDIPVGRITATVGDFSATIVVPLDDSDEEQRSVDLDFLVDHFADIFDQGMAEFEHQWLEQQAQAVGA
jgi:hypothetical protein